MDSFTRKFVLICFIGLIVGCGKSVYSEKVTRYYDEKVKGDDSGTENEVAFSLIPSYGGVHSASGWKVQPIIVQHDENFDEQQLSAIKMVLETFNTVIGRELLVQGGSIPPRDDSSTLYEYEDHTNLKVYKREEWSVTGKSSLILGTAIWQNERDRLDVITSAEIHLNAENYHFVDALQSDLEETDDRELVDTETLLLHEFGHALGLSHRLKSEDSSSVMLSTVFIGKGMANRKLSEMDIELLRKIY